MARYDEKKIVYSYHKIPADINIHKDGNVEIIIEGKLLQLTKTQFDEIEKTRFNFINRK